ncbi:MAG: hypothetical protein U0869_19925 [Chloroflexota bacterium]
MRRWLLDDQPTCPGPVLQLRLVVETPDYDDALAFYRDVLGLQLEAAFAGRTACRSRSLRPAPPWS